MFKWLKASYDTLSDPVKRDAYDQKLFSGADLEEIIVWEDDPEESNTMGLEDYRRDVLSRRASISDNLRKIYRELQYLDKKFDGYPNDVFRVYRMLSLGLGEVSDALWLSKQVIAKKEIMEKSRKGRNLGVENGG